MSDLLKPIVWPEVPNDGEPATPNWPTLYTDLATMRMEAWTRRAKAYEKDPEDFYSAWNFLHHHPVFWYFGRRKHESQLCWERGIDEGLEFRVVKVDPETLRIEDEKARNTLVQIWVEVFPSSFHADGRDGRLHDYVCDTGGATYEDAVIQVAKEIYKRHGNDRVVLSREWSGA